jgi:hypothetical protein
MRSLLTAIIAMMSSVAFPKVARRNADRPGPDLMASSSVARPMRSARGMIAPAAPANTIQDDAPTILAAMAIGAPIRKIKAPFSIRLKGSVVLNRPSFPLPPVMVSGGSLSVGSSSRSWIILSASSSSSASESSRVSLGSSTILPEKVVRPS